jgi:serine/threonine protein kinase
LHLNNVLVTDEFFPHEPPPFNHQYQYLISDVGESKMLNDLRQTDERAAARASYGAIEFRAPEIHQNIGWTKMADVFAFGVIICKILNCRRVECQSPPPDWVIHPLNLYGADSKATEKLSKMIVPKPLKEITEKCLMYNPRKRPTMGEVVSVLDRLLTEFGMDLDNQNSDNEDPDNENSGGESWESDVSGDETMAIEWTSWDWERYLARSRIPEEQVAMDASDEEPPEDD